jgi:murein DD-endopeptidase MepM/ murein hydrolase activator NlpD
VDHDRPDYSIDGTIVLANGLTARASDGVASDLFPAYWSPSLRQFINYDGHNGYDFDISYQPVLAAAAGTVEYAGWNDPNPYVGYGQMALIDHHNGYVTLYGHLSKLEVSTGDRVSTGQEIGISGTTGRSSGPHLHFTVFHDCEVADPYGWTGHGTDPLQTFTGERSVYLWLPGHDPLLLNPPPGWPSYPTGLQVSFPAGSAAFEPRSSLPVDRLLLLALPSAQNSPAFDPAAALARTSAAINGEADQLMPQLDELRAEGLVGGYQLIPSAAAVWVRGTAAADQLEGLTGVASLAGVQPHDVSAAEAGLAHAVLAQTRSEQTPSLWPVGFRSGLHAWRPIATVLSGQALVAGTALPGKQVVVSLQRGSRIPAAAVTVADADTGGFVAVLHDALGDAYSVASGDTIRVTCDGRTAVILVRSGHLSARTGSIGGETVPNATLRLSVLAPVGDPPSALTADAAGTFRIAAPGHLPAGTQVVAGFRDPAGNEQAVSAFVPGLSLVEGSNLVRGWTAGRSPQLAIRRSGRVSVDAALQTRVDGSFAIALGGTDGAFALRPGDEVTIGSPAHHRLIVLPALSLDLGTHGVVWLHGPPGGVSTISLVTASGDAWRRTVTVPASGRAQVSFPITAIGAGDRARASLQTTAGDSVAVSVEPIKVTLEEGTPNIGGIARPGQVLTVRLLDARGRIRGEAAAVGDPAHGRFHAVLRGTGGAPVNTGRGTRLLLGFDGSSRAEVFPVVRLLLARARNAITVLSPPSTVLTASVLSSSGSRTIPIHVGSDGRAVVALAGRSVKMVSALWRGPDGLIVRRAIQVGSRH